MNTKLANYLNEEATKLKEEQTKTANASKCNCNMPDAWHMACPIHSPVKPADAHAAAASQFEEQALHDGSMTPNVRATVNRVKATAHPAAAGAGAHTPGPWKWFVNYHCPGKLKGAYVDAQGSTPARIADVLAHGDVGSQEACEANASLIAAAPETAAERDYFAKANNEEQIRNRKLQHDLGEVIQQRDQAREQVKTLLAACKFMFNAIESGELVRDISRDSEPDWAIRMMKFTVELGKAQAAIASVESEGK